MSIPIIRYIPVVNSLTENFIAVAENALELVFGTLIEEVEPTQQDYVLAPSSHTHNELVTLIAEEMMELRHQLTSRNYPEPDGIRKNLPYWWDSKEGQWLAAPDGVYFNHHLIDNLDVLERDAYVMLAAVHASRTLAATATNEDKELFELNRPNLEMLEMARDAQLIVGAYGNNGAFWTWGTVQGWNDDDKIETIVIKTTDNFLIPVPGNRILISDKSVDIVADQAKGESGEG